jgi:DNA-binding NtrC family response regulator
LDELAEMPIGTQAKLLRVLEDSKVRRLGGKTETVVDVRVVAATNRPPDEAVKKGMLREDLYYRLNVFELKLPPLRQRLDDIPVLCEAMLRDMNEKNGTRVTGMDADVLVRLTRHNWPGNVRELRNVMERAAILAGQGQLQVSHIPPGLGAGVSLATMGAEGSAAGGGAQASGETITLPVGTTVHDAEKAMIFLTLAHTKNNKTRAAEILGISLKTLFNKLKEYGSATQSEAEVL